MDLKKTLLIGASALIITPICYNQAIAEIQPHDLNRAKLESIAENFVNKLKRHYEAPQSIETTLIPDNTELMLNISMKSLILNDDILTFTKDNGLYVGFSDFTFGVGFVINTDNKNKTASGWFREEKNKFSFDLNKRQVTINGKITTIDENSYEMRYGQIYFPKELIGEWFDLEIKPKYDQLLLSIISDYDFPIEKKIARRKSSKPNAATNVPVKNARLIEEEIDVNTPNIDATLLTTYRKQERGAPSSRTTRYTINSTGEILGTTNKNFIIGDNTSGLHNIRSVFTKELKNKKIMNIIPADKIEFGDISPVRNTNLPSDPQELGIKISNIPENSTRHKTTYFEGNTPPDWDIDLYRNDIKIDFLTVDSLGYYKFNDVKLYAGKNNFELIYYGPQGEIRTETKSIPISLQSLKDNSNSYEISATLNNINTFNKLRTTQQDDAKLSLAGNYYQSITDNIETNIGAKSIIVNNERNHYLSAAISTNISNTIINADIAHDVKNNSSAYYLLGRQTLDKHQYNLSVQYKAKNHNAITETDTPSSIHYEGELSGSFLENKDTIQYNTSAYHTETSDDTNASGVNMNISKRFGDIKASNNLRYQINKGSTGEISEKLDDRISLAGRIFQTNLRLNANYMIKPEKKLSSLSMDINKKIKQNVSSKFNLSHHPTNDYTRGEISLNWTTDKGIISPQITRDNHGYTTASLNLRVSTAKEPISGEIKFSSSPLTNSGGISAFVYLDKDGDRIFNNDDEPLKDVIIKAVQSNITVLTDENGIAFLKKLPNRRPTDINLDQGSLEDPFWMSANQGVSIIPRPSVYSKIEFPIHISGEIDGYVYKKQKNNKISPVKGINIHLHDKSGKIIASTATAYDGFYVFSLVPPGNYNMVINRGNAKTLELYRPMPKEIKIDYKGTILYGLDLMMSETEGIEYNIQSDIEDFKAQNAHIQFPDISNEQAILNLGDYSSNLMMALTWHKIKNRYSAILGDYELLIKPSQSMAYGKEKHGLRLIIKDANITEMASRCKSLQARNIKCRIDILPAAPKIANSAL